MQPRMGVLQLLYHVSQHARYRIFEQARYIASCGKHSQDIRLGLNDAYS